MTDQNEVFLETTEPVSVGLQLRNARERAGLTIEDIAQQTFIRPDILRDFEADRFQSAGGIAYARGHIRTIAKILGANADTLISDLELLTGEVDRPMIDLLTENSATAPRRQLPKFSYKALSGVAAAVIAALILVPAVASLTRSNTSSSQTTTNKDVPAPRSDAGNLTAVATKTSDVSVIISGISGNSWVGVTDAAGNQVFSGRISAGTAQTFTDNQLLYFVIGNAGAVNLNVNGKDLGTPGAVGEVLHLQFGPGNSSQG